MATRLPPQRVAVTGASGLIGTALVGHLRNEGHTVQRFVRRPAIARDEITWDPKAGTVDLTALEGVDAVIHLAGAGVGDKRWTKKYKSTILNSRLLGTTAIANAVATVKPSVFISASAIGWYGETGNRAVTEADRGGDDFLSAVCREWEGAADLAGDVDAHRADRQPKLLELVVAALQLVVGEGHRVGTFHSPLHLDEHHGAVVC